MTNWLLLSAAITSEVTGSLALKGAIDHPLLYAPVAIGFVSAFLLLATLLRRGMPLGVVYGVWSASGVALTAVLSTVIYDEPFTWVMAVGLALIMGGVLLVETGAHTTASPEPVDAHSPVRAA